MKQVKSKDQKKAEEILMWATEELHKNLTNIIINMQNHPRPYYMLIHMTDGYHGKPAELVGKIRNDLLNSTHVPSPDEFVKGERIIDLSKMKVVHNTINLYEEWHLPKYVPVPLISTSLIRVDNRQGRAQWIYILPPDKPVIWGCDIGEQSEFVFRSAVKSNAPIVN